MEKAMAPHSSTLAWKIPWTEDPDGPQSVGLLRVGHDWATSLSLFCTGERNGNPFQCSCLENPRDGGAWWAAVYGVAQSRTRLKRLSSSSSLQHINNLLSPKSELLSMQFLTPGMSLFSFHAWDPCLKLWFGPEWNSVGRADGLSRELPAQSRLPSAWCPTAWPLYPLTQAYAQLLTSQCWQKAVQEIVFICSLHLPPAKSLSCSDIRPSFLTEIWTKHLPQHARRRAQPLSLQGPEPLPRAGLYTYRPLRCCSCQTAAGTFSRRDIGDRWLGLQGCWWDPRKAKVVSEGRKHGDSLHSSSPFFLSAITHSGRVSQESCLVMRKFNFEQDSNSTTFFFT